MLTILRLLVLASWLAVAVYMAPAVWAMIRGRGVRSGDPARLVCFGYAAVSVGFSLRWLALPNSEDVWAALYVFSVIVALLTLVSARSYGRGPMV